MSQTYGGDDEEGDEGDDLGGVEEAKFRADTDLLIERFRVFEDGAREIGLYVDDHQITAAHNAMGGHQAALVCQFSVGDVAFSRRVQDPDGYDFDAQFREMELDAQTDEWLDQRTRIMRNMAAGRDALDDGPDNA